MRRSWYAVALALAAACGDPSPTARAISPLGAPNPALNSDPSDDLEIGGAFRTSVPIAVPTFHGLQPQLGLGYDSGGGEGPLGAGWSLHGWSQITRRGPAGGAPRFAADDSYWLDGMELLPCAAATRPSASCTAGGTHTTGTESYVKVFREGDEWWLTSKEGTRSTYTAEPIASSRGTSRWSIARVADLRGNAVDYALWCDGSDDCYPGTISYGAPAALASTVTFHYEARPDVPTAATGEGLTRTRKRLRSIDIANAGQRLRAYALTYTVPTDLGASVLQAVTEYGRTATVDAAGAVSGPSLPAHTFARTPPSASAWTAASTTIPTAFDAAPQPTIAGSADPAVGSTLQRRATFGDIDGDGRTDSVVVDFGASPVAVQVTRATAGGGFAPTVVTPLPGWPTRGNPMLADHDGDGRDDLLVVASVGAVEVLNVARGNADGSLAPLAAASLGINRHTGSYQLGDVDGDGRSDLIAITRTVQPDSLDTVIVYARSESGALTSRSFATGLSSRGEPDASLPFEHPTLRLPDPVWTSGDANGDGRTDLFRLEAIPSVNGDTQQLRVRTWIAVDGPDLFEATVSDPGVPWGMAASPRTYDRVHGGDFNADGRSDLVFVNVREVGGVATTVLHTLLGHGDGTFDVVFTDTEMGPLLLGAVSEGAPFIHPFQIAWMTGDIDGDLATDLVLATPAAGAFSMAAWPSTVALIELVSDRKGRFVPRVRRQTDWVLEAWLRCNGQGTCTRETDRMLFDIALADIDADGRADVFYAAAGTSVLNLRTDRSPVTAIDSQRWIPTDVTGDGRRDLVYPQLTAAGLRVHSSLGTGSIGRDEVAADVLPGWAAADVASWRAVDAGGPSGPDGRADLVYVERTPTGIEVHTLLAAGGGQWTAHATAISGGFDRYRAWRAIDVDGDGDSDLVDVWREPSGGMRVVTLASDGRGGWARTADAVVFTGAGPFASLGFAPADLDGDGRSDLIAIDATSASGAPQLRSLRSTGTGSWLASATTAPTANAAGSPRTVSYGRDVAAFSVADVNGDGKTDLVRLRVPDLFGRVLSPGDVQIVALLSHGDGAFTATETYAGLVAGARREVAAAGWQTADVNDDGLIDFVQLYGIHDPQFLDDRLHVHTLRDERGGFAHDRDLWVHDRRDTLRATVDDWDGDGRDGPMFVTMVQSGFGAPRIQPVVYELDSARVPARLTEVENGLGLTRTVTYQTTAGVHEAMPLGLLLRVVSEISTLVEPSRQRAWATARYEGATWSFAERAFVGFARTTLTDGSSYLETRHARTVACADAIVERSTGGTAPGRPLIRRERTDYEDTSASGRLPHLCQPVVRYADDYDYGSQPRTYRSELAWDVYGNPTREADAYRTIDRTFAIDTARYWVGALASETTTDRSGVQLAASLIDHDAAGNPERQQRFDSSSGGWVEARKEHDAAGHVVATIDEAGVRRTYAMDPHLGRYVSRVCDAATCTEIEYDDVLGEPVRETDANGASIQHTYDGFGRRTRTTFADGGCLAWQYHAFGVPHSQRVETYRCEQPNQVFDGLGSGLGVVGYFDGAQRGYRQVRSGGFERETRYVGLTRLIAEQTSWHAAGGRGRSERYTYDQGRREIRLEHGDGTFVERRYALGEEAILDELGHVRYLRRDERGQLSQIEQVATVNGAPTAIVTSYTADALGRQVKIEDAAGNLTTRVWSSLGHELETCDPDRGCSTQRYRPNGQLVRRDDAAGQWFELAYDGAGRIARRTDSAGDQVDYAYDLDPATSQPRGASRGRLVAVTGAHTGSELYRYDVRGRVEHTEKCIAGTCMAWAEGFDLAGRQANVSYPDSNGAVSSSSEVVAYSYDTAGRVSRVASPQMIYADELRYDAEDRLTDEVLGNGVVTHHDFDAERAQLRSSRVTLGGATLFAAGYDYDAASRLAQHTWEDPTPGSFKAQHDELGRLLEVTGSAGNFAYSYDALGNLTWSSTLGNYEYRDPAHVHAVTDANGASYRYDALGQLIDDGTRQLRWSVDGMPTSIDAPSGRVDFAYDAAGARIEKAGPSGTTQYFGPLVELTNGKPTHHVRATGRVLASRDGNGVTWHHLDRLGSVRLTTDEQGQVIKRFAYAPFGSEATSGIAGALFGYAGHRGDQETGLVYMQARYYDPALGRFVSPDSIIPNPLDPQTLNRYTYADNAPLDKVDPDGHQSKCPPSTNNSTCVSAPRDPSPVMEMLKRWALERTGLFDRQKFARTLGDLVRRGRDEVVYPNGRGYGKEFVYVAVCPSCHYERTTKPGDVDREMTRDEKDELATAVVRTMDLIDRSGRLGNVAYAYASNTDFVEIDHSEVSTQAVSERELQGLQDRLMSVKVDEAAVPEGGGGRAGNNLTRAQNEAIADTLKQDGWKVTNGAGSGKGEAYIQGFGGYDKNGKWSTKVGSVFTDVTAQKSGTTLHVQTVDTRKSDGWMTTREDRNDARARAATDGKKQQIMVVPKQTRMK